MNPAVLALGFAVVAVVFGAAFALRPAATDRVICRACHRTYRHFHSCQAPTLIGFCLDCDRRREVTTAGVCVACGSSSTMRIEVVA